MGGDRRSAPLRNATVPSDNCRVPKTKYEVNPAAVERARESVAALLGCRPSEIVFTSGGTEGDNLAIFGIAGPGLSKPGRHVVSSTIEHHAVLNPCKHLETTGVEVSYIPVDGRGQVDPDDVRKALAGGGR